MITWFDSIWQWIITNWDGIVGLLTSTTFISTLGVIFTVSKNSKLSKKVELSMSSFNTYVSDTTNIKEHTEGINKALNKLEELVINTCNDVTSSNNDNSVIIEDLQLKLNAILEVQTMVYSTIKDDNIRTAVNSVLISAKNKSTVDKVELMREVESLKAVISQKAKDLEEVIKEPTIVTEVQSETEIKDAKTETLTRY